MQRLFALGALLAFPVASLAQPMILASSVMDVTDATFDFVTVENAVVILASNNGTDPTDIIIDYGSSPVFLVVNETTIDDNGCATFEASLPRSIDNHDGHRFHINLKSDYGCQYLSQPWQAYVREGYGWCGTMDSTMNLVGDPKWNAAQP